MQNSYKHVVTLTASIVFALLGARDARSATPVSANAVSVTRPGWSVGFFPGYRLVAGAKQFPLDFLNGGLSSSLTVRYHLSGHGALRLQFSLSRSSSDGGRELGTYVDEFGQPVEVIIKLPQFSLSSLSLSFEHEWNLGHNPAADNRIAFRLGGGFSHLSGSATYYFFVFQQNLYSAILTYPDESDPMFFIGVSYSRNLVNYFRFEAGIELPAFVSTSPGFDELARFRSASSFVVLMPTIYAGLWFMIGRG